MKVTKVTPVEQKPDSEATLEAYFGEFKEVEEDWYRSDADALEQALNVAGLQYREYTLIRKAVGFETGLVVGLLIWGGKEVFKVFAAWLPAREGRKIRIKFKDGSEIEAHSIEELEELRNKFLPSAADDDAARGD